MSRLRTREWIRDQARELADEVTGAAGFITDATANEWINQGYAKLVDLLVGANPDWYLADVEIQTTPGTREYAVPDDFYQVRGVDMVLSAEHVVTLEPFNFLDRNRHQDQWPPPRWTDVETRVRYRVLRKGIDGDETRLRFEPDPLGKLYRLWYVRAAQDLEDDADELDGVNGYEEFIVADVAMKMMVKAETDPSPAMALKAEAVDRINEMARKRDQGRPVQVADTRTSRRF
jgi:hypothetical protein